MRLSRSGVKGKELDSSRLLKRQEDCKACQARGGNTTVARFQSLPIGRTENRIQSGNETAMSRESISVFQTGGDDKRGEGKGCGWVEE